MQRQTLVTMAVTMVIIVFGCGEHRARPVQPQAAHQATAASADPVATFAGMAAAPAEGAASCPATPASRAGWFDVGGAAPAPDGVRSRAAASGSGLVTGVGLGGAAVTFAADRPVVAYAHGSGVRVLHLLDGRWLPLGAQDTELGVRGVGASGARGARLRDGFGISAPAVGSDGKGGVIVAWVDGAPPWQGKARAVRWDGAAWRDASPRGGRALGCQRWDIEFGASSEMPRLHVGPRGDLWAACVQPRAVASKRDKGQKAGSGRITMMPSPGPRSRPALEVRRWTGTRWQTLPDVWLGAPGTMVEVTASHGVALAADKDGSLVVLHATRATPAAGELRWQALRWHRNRWSTTPVSVSAGARFLDLTATADGDARALWLENDKHLNTTKNDTNDFNNIDNNEIVIRDIMNGAALARVPMPNGLADALASPARLAASALQQALAPGPAALGRDGRMVLISQDLIAVEYLPRVLRVHVWTGAAWMDEGATRWPGGVSRTPGASRAPALAVDGCGLPVVAWLQAHPQGSDVYVRRFTGARWDELGGSASGGGVSGSGDALAPALTVDEHGRPVVLWWQQSLVEHRLRAVARVRRFERGRWHDVGAAVELGGVQPLAANSAIWARDGRIVAATPDVQSGGVAVLRWDGQRWSHDGTDSATANTAWLWPQIAANGEIQAVVLDAAAGALRVVAWQKGWQLARSVAVGDVARLGQAGVRVGAGGRLHVAWVAAHAWPGDVQVAVEQGAGMAAVSGSPSNSEAHSMEPAVHEHDGRLCVAWSEPDIIDTEIFVRCRDN